MTRLRILLLASAAFLVPAVALAQTTPAPPPADEQEQAEAEEGEDEAEDTAVESSKAYLSAIVTRLAIDHLKSARVRRETYVGEWLPEPLVTDHLRAGRLVALKPDQSFDVPLFWQQSRIVSPVLGNVTRAVVSAAKTMLIAKVGT